MIRRSFQSSRFVSSSFGAAGVAGITCFSFSSAPTTSASATRGVFVFTEQNPVLANNAKHLGYKSNVWVEGEDDWWWSKLTKLKKDQRATETTVKRLIEYYSLDALINKAELEKDLPANETSATAGYHTSFRSKMPFRGAIAEEFEQAAALHGYTSKFWISAQEVKKNKYPLVRGTKATAVVFTTTGKLYNAEQFENSDVIAKTPMSGMKRKPYAGDFHAALVKDIAANNYPTGLYFTLNQLEHFGLASQLRPDAMPVQLHLTQLRGSLQLYNLDEVENGDKLAEELQRFPVDEDTFLISGRPVRDAKTLEEMKKAASSSSASAGGKAKKSAASCGKYWISEKDLLARQYQLKTGATGVAFQGAQQPTSQFTVLMYNAEQLEKPQLAFELAGTKGQL